MNYGFVDEGAVAYFNVIYADLIIYKVRYVKPES